MGYSVRTEEDQDNPLLRQLGESEPEFQLDLAVMTDQPTILGKDYTRGGEVDINRMRSRTSSGQVTSPLYLDRKPPAVWPCFEVKDGIREIAGLRDRGCPDKSGSTCKVQSLKACRTWGGCGDGWRRWGKYGEAASLSTAKVVPVIRSLLLSPPRAAVECMIHASGREVVHPDNWLHGPPRATGSQKREARSN